MPKITSGIDLRGVWTALVTPFNSNGVNLSKLTDLVQLACDQKITGVVPLGSTGEAAAMDGKEHSAVIETTIRAADGRLSVMVGVGTNNTPKTIENIKRAYDFGANATLVVAPYYNKPTPAGLRRHFLTVADSSPLPIVLYHIPGRCGVGIPPDLVIELARHPKIIGIKEAGGDVWRSGELARLTTKKFSVLSGDDPLTLPLLAVGAVGVISVISNLAPNLTKKMVDAALEGDFTKALRLNSRIAPLLNALSLETNPSPIKEAMNITGMKVGQVRPPLARVQHKTNLAIKSALEIVGDIK